MSEPDLSVSIVHGPEVPDGHVLDAMTLSLNRDGHTLITLPIREAIAFAELIPAIVDDAWMPVQLPKSSNIARVLYCRVKATVRVTFAGGGVYEYFAVPEDVIYQWMEAESAGKFLNTVLKNEAVFPCRKIEST